MRTLMAILLCAVAGCAALEPGDSAREPVSVALRSPAPSRSRPSDVVAYLGELRSMNEPSLAREIARQRQLLAKDGGSDISRTRLAIALSVSPQGDEAEILALVDPVARKETAHQDVRAMASFLHAMAGERRRLKESAAAANAKLRDERKAVEAQKQRADTAQERAAQLQQKLDALTDLEKSLSDRSNQTR